VKERLKGREEEGRNERSKERRECRKGQKFYGEGREERRKDWKVALLKGRRKN